MINRQTGPSVSCLQCWVHGRTDIIPLFVQQIDRRCVQTDRCLSNFSLPKQSIRLTEEI